MAEFNGKQGVWRTVGGRRIFIADGDDLATAMKKSGKFDEPKKSLGTIRGEEIRSFTLYGDETGEAGEFTSLRELYEQMQDIKRMDRRDYGYTDNFTVQINTDTSCYEGYTIYKRNGRYKLK